MEINEAIGIFERYYTQYTGAEYYHPEELFGRCVVPNGRFKLEDYHVDETEESIRTIGKVLKTKETRDELNVILDRYGDDYACAAPVDIDKDVREGNIRFDKLKPYLKKIKKNTHTSSIADSGYILRECKKALRKEKAPAYLIDFYEALSELWSFFSHTLCLGASMSSLI